LLTYEEKVREEVLRWRSQLLKRSSFMNRMAKQAQMKVNRLIPQNVHDMITMAVKKVVEAALIGSEYLTKPKEVTHLSLEQKEKLIYERINKYKKTAAIEGAGTGAGGILLSLADFPILLSIKMKLLFDIGAHYGFRVQQYEERLFILHLFQLAFSSDEQRKKTLHIIENWQIVKDQLTDLDWRTFQQEYRDHIDLAKMLQMVPGLGAVVGAYANYHFIEKLGETAINGYRFRLLNITGKD
jgi:EcsC protein family